jgi:hypothetical protein
MTAVDLNILSSWFILVLGSLATFRLSHLVTKERGPLAMFERLRKALPRGRGSLNEWVNCIWCFSLTASALVCLILWAGGISSLGISASSIGWHLARSLSSFTKPAGDVGDCRAQF